MSEPNLQWPSREELANILESGKYEKGDGALCKYLGDTPLTPDPKNPEDWGFCCLGVAAVEAGILNLMDLPELRNRNMLSNRPGVEKALGPQEPDDVLGYFPAWMSDVMEANLARLNDDFQTWAAVVAYLRGAPYPETNAIGLEEEGGE